jgi:excisionase family DNA binding protein
VTRISIGFVPHGRDADAVRGPNETSVFQSEPPGDRTQDPRLKRPGRNVGPDGKDSQALAITRQVSGDGSSEHQVLAGFRKRFADSLLTVPEVAAHLRVSTRTVYTLCEQGKLAHVRILNAIRVEPAALAAFISSRTE